MKTVERITLAATATAALAATAYCVQKMIRNRLDRVFRIAAGESGYEREHTKMHHHHS